MKRLKIVGKALAFTLLISQMGPARAILPGGCIMSIDQLFACKDVFFDQIEKLLTIKKEAQIIFDKVISRQFVRSYIAAPVFASEELENAIENFNYAVNYVSPLKKNCWFPPHVAKKLRAGEAFYRLKEVIIDEKNMLLNLEK